MKRQKDGRFLPDPNSGTAKVIAHIMSGRTITALEAVQYGVCRLADVVHNYRQKHGYDSIVTEMVESESGKRYARYKREMRNDTQKRDQKMG